MMKYTKLQTKFVEEIQSNITIYKHNKTNARICTIENDDNNKVFSIAFRTPPINSTGLTHILEHSVLCGSKNYPVKDPFVELLKSSLNTFLNAFTFPDKTMYPCASQNDKDFKNLMSVYMDAVFYPQIYKHEEIFMQEGWHYHILDKNDPITYNGVVYNEMKGAFSDPEQILFRSVMHSLYPDTAYGYESGGDPKYIPDLSFEQFKDFHHKFYHPSNSYIMIYGNCDMEERMNWLDEAYLKDFDAIDFDTTIKSQDAFKNPKYHVEYYPVAKDEKLDNKTFLSYNLALPTTLDTKLMIAFSILVNALFDMPGAPLKQALIDANLGQDVQTLFDDGLLQPLLTIMVYNSNSNKENEFINLVNTKLEEIANNGLNKEVLLSLLSFAEFKARERLFSSRMPQGLEIQMTCLASWLYNDDEPFTKLEVLKYYSELKNEIENGYFENIIKKYFINNNHKSFVKLEPSHTYADETKKALDEKLAQYKSSLSNSELEALIAKNKALEEYQSAESTPEEIDTLPKLKLEDIDSEPEKYNCELISGKYDTIFNDYFTNDIAYVNYYFDISNLNKEDVLTTQLFCDLFKNVSTNSMSYQEINQFILKNTGGINAAMLTTVDKERNTSLRLRLSYSATSLNISKANDLLVDIIKNSNFKDEKRLYERICEVKLNNEMSVSSKGHVYALMRAGSYCDAAAYYSDLIGGLSYLDYLTSLVNNFDSLKEELIPKLENIYISLFSKENFLLGFAGTKKQYESLKCTFDDFYKMLNDKTNYERSVPTYSKLNEGIKTQYDVNFVARAGKFDQPFDGALLVLNNAISLNYLWMQVRVHGGAYGCNMQIKPYGYLGLTSYRDPEIKRTNKVYDDVVDFIRNLNPTEEELLKFKIGALGSLDAVMHVKEKSIVAQTQYLSGSTYEIRKKYREELINATKEKLNSFAPIFENALSQNNLCVIGNADKISDNVDMFVSIRSLTK
ncbi:MAG: insulinase family protein [Erysipelotrichaceae bacterium]|nr:insulinase family protein [Erysipelotrichaceae bacterium]